MSRDLLCRVVAYSCYTAAWVHFRVITVIGSRLNVTVCVTYYFLPILALERQWFLSYVTRRNSRSPQQMFCPTRAMQCVHAELFVCLLLNGTSALFRPLVPRIVEIEHTNHVKNDLR